MRIADTWRALVGGTVVYVVMAASCSTSAGSGPFGMLDGGPETGAGGEPAVAAGGAMGDSAVSGVAVDGASRRRKDAASIVDAALDRIIHPVRDARADANESGTRLRAKYLQGSDGSRNFLRWYDSERKEDCYFAGASDGATRCLPIFGLASLGSYFSDSGCVDMLALRSHSDCSAPRYAQRSTLACNAGSVTYDLFTVGAPITSGSVYKGTPGACTAVQVSALATFDLYAVGREEPPTSFVSATELVE